VIQLVRSSCIIFSLRLVSPETGKGNKSVSDDTYSKVRVGKHLSDMFTRKNGLKQGEALSSLLFNFAVEIAVRRVQVNKYGLKLYGTHQLLVYTDDVNIMGGIVHTVRKNTKALVVDSKETCLEVNGDTAVYMVMSRDQKTRRSHNINNDDCSCERVVQFKYLETNLTYRNSIQEQIKNILTTGNFFCLPVCSPKIERLRYTEP